MIGLGLRPDPEEGVKMVQTFLGCAFGDPFGSLLPVPVVVVLRWRKKLRKEEEERGGKAPEIEEVRAYC
jgi:hypothetical protein